MSLDIIKHYPVMLNEVTRYIQDNQTILDCTFGGGSYSNEILKKFKNNYVIAVDRDKNVIQFADSISKKYINRFSFNNITFSNIKDLKEFKNHLRRLPKAHTCFSTVDIPDYTEEAAKKEYFKARLEYALQESNLAGYQFA